MIGYKAGFTLLETLVALVITALASVLIMQGLSHALMLRERVVEHTQFQREDMLRRAWFGESVNALIADIPRIERHRFRGDADGFHGLTLAPLQELPGVPVAVDWSIEREDDIVHLYYQQPDRARQRVWSWRAETARFAYFDPQLGWSARWPPATANASPLPASVAFVSEWRDKPLTWVASVLGARTPRNGLELPEEFR